LRGRVQSAKGKPVRGARVFALDPAFEVPDELDWQSFEPWTALERAVTPADGRFVLDDLPRTPCRLVVVPPLRRGYNSFRRDVKKECVVTEPITEVGKPIEITLDGAMEWPAGHVSVDVFWRRPGFWERPGEPVGVGLHVMLQLDAKRVPGRFLDRYKGDVVGPGRAEFSDVPAGNYWVIVEVEGVLRDSRRIRVGPGEPAAPVSFTIKRD
jgi:hypothetical protein